mmetsp:Transcript_17642/g.22872  ORF Transcript_17642/g.22872 Transcript_17642/m.22872 type:complete len:528 (-) Transcript_17642:416-1999(-)
MIPLCRYFPLILTFLQHVFLAQSFTNSFRPSCPAKRWSIEIAIQSLQSSNSEMSCSLTSASSNLNATDAAEESSRTQTKKPRSTPTRGKPGVKKRSTATNKSKPKTPGISITANSSEKKQKNSLSVKKKGKKSVSAAKTKITNSSSKQAKTVSQLQRMSTPNKNRKPRKLGPPSRSTMKSQSSDKNRNLHEKQSPVQEKAKLKRLNELENMCESSSKSGEFALIKLAQEADRLMELHKKMTNDLGYEPSLEVWAAAASLPCLSLERKITTGQKAKKEIVSSNMGLVRKSLVPYRTIEKTGMGGLTLQDLEQEGVFGLIRAVEKFDLTRTNRFSTYAMWWIKSTLKHAVAGKDSVIRIPYQTLQDVNKIKKERYELSGILQRQPTERELCKRLGWSIQKLRKFDVYTSQGVSSMDTPINPRKLGEGPRSGSLAETHFDEDESSSILDRDIVGSDEIESLLKAYLHPKEREVIRLRFGLDDGEARTYVQCASILGFSTEYVRKKANASIQKLQEALVMDGQLREALSSR